jgi:hypothetical protein
MAKAVVSIFNASTVLTDAQVLTAFPDFQTQVTRDFAPVHGRDATLSFVPKGTPFPPNAWQIGIFDDSDQAGALGYHDFTAGGMPFGKVFAKTDQQYGYNWTITLSHELLEMLADPDIIRCVIVQTTSASRGTVYAYEVGDPVEADQYGYKIGHTMVSDFIWPTYFEIGWPSGTQYDQTKHVAKPFQILPGGYQLAFNVSSGRWTQLTSNIGSMNARESVMQKFRSRPHPGSRRSKRMMDQDDLLRSV